MNVKHSLGSKIRGWFPDEPKIYGILKNNSQAQSSHDGLKDQKRIAIANTALLMAFLGTHFLIDPFNKSVLVSVGFWLTFVPTVIVVNYLLYQRSKRRKLSQS